VAPLPNFTSNLVVAPQANSQEMTLKMTQNLTFKEATSFNPPLPYLDPHIPKATRLCHSSPRSAQYDTRLRTLFSPRPRVPIHAKKTPSDADKGPTALPKLRQHTLPWQLNKIPAIRCDSTQTTKNVWRCSYSTPKFLNPAVTPIKTITQPACHDLRPIILPL